MWGDYGRGKRGDSSVRKDGVPISHHVGEVSSKYGYSNGGDLFERDLQRRHEESEALYAEFKAWMRSKNVDPRKFRELFLRYYDEFIEEVGIDESQTTKV